MHNLKIQSEGLLQFFGRRATLLSLGFLALFAQSGQAADSLSYFKNYFVTGDYVVGGVGLRGTGVNGFATGTINMSGVPAGADIVAAFLYWETEESANSPSAVNGFFRGQAIVGKVLGNPQNPACWSSGGTGGPSKASGRVYRADVLRYLAVDQTKNVRVANGPHTVKLPDSGGNGNGNVLYGDGASLVVIYRVLTAGTPLKAVVLYDGAYTLNKKTAPMTQTIAGFYQASGPTARMTQIVANGQQQSHETLRVDGVTIGSNNPFTGGAGSRWDNPTFNINLAANAVSYQTQVTTSGEDDDDKACMTWGAIVTGTNVVDSDADGLLDVWETGGLHLNSQATPATFGRCSDYPSEPCANLPAMGADPTRRDIFTEIDWLHGSDGHLHKPKIAALSAIGDAFAVHGIQLHFDVGNNYQAPASPYIVPAAYAQGGEVIEESTLLCPNAKTNVCTYSEPYSVQSWKVGFRATKDGFPALAMPAHFGRDRKDIFHYVLFAHALAGPFDAAGRPTSTHPKSVSGVADRPGGDLMVTLGLWLSDNPPGCDPSVDCTDQTGSVLIQAGTLMHELGHNLGLSHAGLYRTPNCEANYPSVMNYLYQTRGLTDALGGTHIDYSNGRMPALNENSLSESAFTGALPPYRVRYYGPPSALDASLGRTAKVHCDGTPLNGDLAVRLESPIGAAIDWNNNGRTTDGGPLPLDIDFSGTIGNGINPASGTFFVDTDDWGSLNLRQIGARLDVSGLSADVGQTDLGQTDLGQTDLGQTDLGQTDLGQTDLGQTDLGQTDLGQTDLGDVDYDTVVSTLDPTSSEHPLTATSSLTSITLSWGAPSIGQIRQYNIYRTADPNGIFSIPPTLVATLSGAPPLTTYTDTVNGSTTLYNTTYTYFMTSVDINGTNSGPSNAPSGIVKHLYIQANDKSRVYGSLEPAFDYTTTGLDPGVLTGTTTCTTTAIQTSNVGTYPITCSGLTPVAGVTYTPGTLTITKATATIVVTPYNLVYDGNPHTATGTATGVLGETLSGLNLSATTHTNAGVYATDPWTFTNNINYFDANGTVSDNIARANPTIAVAGYNLTYDATPHTATGTATGVKGESLAGLNLSGTTHTDAGNYTDPWTFTDVTGNYNSPAGTVGDVIIKATPVVTAVGGTYIRDGLPHPATGAVSGVGGVILGTPSFTYTPPGNATVPVNVGVYAAVGSFPGNNNYFPASSAPVSIKINGFITTGPMATARSYHTSTLLPGGKVLITGGLSSSNASLATSEVYNPATGTFSPTLNNMPNKARGHTATLLGNGKVLVAGGGNASSQLYDPATNRWSAGGGMSSQRSYHTATLLPNGKVLLAGGTGNHEGSTTSAQLYDPVAGTFSSTGNMKVSRELHTSTLLTSGPNAGKVLIVGGRTARGGDDDDSGVTFTFLSSAELYDPSTGVFTLVPGAMTAARFGHTAALVATGVNAGKILIAGGGGSTALASAELYDPIAGTFSAATSMATARQYFTATGISTGILEVGGRNSAGRVASAEQYQDTAFIASDSMAAARSAHTATLLSNGSVLIVGGQGSAGVSIATAELFIVNP